MDIDSHMSYVPELPPYTTNPHHASVEDVDEAAGHSSGTNSSDDNVRYRQDYPHAAGLTKGQGLGTFQKLRAQQMQQNIPPWAPFESEEEWEMARWMMTSGISQKKMNAFLKLKTVSILS